jgi:hypothetical protein
MHSCQQCQNRGKAASPFHCMIASFIIHSFVWQASRRLSEPRQRVLQTAGPHKADWQHHGVSGERSSRPGGFLTAGPKKLPGRLVPALSGADGSLSGSFRVINEGCCGRISLPCWYWRCLSPSSRRRSCTRISTNRRGITQVRLFISISHQLGTAATALPSGA